jgi:hypothetical protein
MSDYSYIKADNVLKKTNYILSHKSKENFDKIKFKTTRETIFNTAIQEGYMFIPGLKFKSISDGTLGKHVITSSIIPADTDFSTILNDTNKSSTSDNINKSIAIYYTGNSSTVYYLRQFWYEDIQPIRPELQINNPTAGIFFRKLGKVYDIINSPESISNYEWINNGFPDLGINNTNNITRTEIYNNEDGYQLLDNVYFLMVLDGDKTVGPAGGFDGDHTTLNVYGLGFTPYKSKEFIDKGQKDKLNQFILFRLEKNNAENGNKEFRLKVFLYNNWTGVDCASTNKNWGKWVCVTTQVQDWTDVIDLYNDNKLFNFAKVGREGGQFPDQLAGNLPGRNTPRHKIIHPNYKLIYKKLLDLPNVKPYICIYGVPNDDTMINFSTDKGLLPSYSQTNYFTNNCNLLMKNFCTKTNDSTTYNNLFTDECKVFCKKNLIGGCDSALQNWCSVNKPIDTVDRNSDEYNNYLKTCGCFMPGNYYNNLDKSYANKGLSLPRCVKKFKYDICSNSDYKDNESVIAPSNSCNVDIINCVQNVEIDNKGNIIGNILIDQSQSKCSKIKLTPPSTPSTPSTPGTPGTPGTPSTPSTPGTPDTPGTGSPVIPPKIPGEGDNNIDDNKILGLDKNLFYGISGGVVLILIILIILIMSKRN